MKQGQTRLWSACAIIVASLGLSGILASGCGDDDDNTTVGTAGSAGTGGKDGGTAGTGGKAGAGGSKEAGPGRLDAPYDATPNQCRALFDAGNACTTACYCDTCPANLVNCVADPDCSVVLACVQRTGCMDAASCNTPATCQAEIIAHGAAVMPLLALVPCLTACAMADCEGGTAEAGPDVRPDITPDTRPDTLPDVSSDQTPPIDVVPDTTPTPDATPDTTPPIDVVPDTTPTPDATPDAVPGDANADSAG